MTPSRLPVGCVALVACAIAGCAPKTARIPGPLAAVGAPVPTAEAGAASVDEGDPRFAERGPKGADAGSVLARAALHYLDARPRGFRDDCSGYVEAVFARAGYPVTGSTAMLYDLAERQGALHHHKVPEPGDLAFFDDTYDRNHNGELDDKLSHVAVVIDVAADGTILLGHGGTSRGRTTLTMNLKHPGDREFDGTLVNEWLRVRHDGDPPGTRYLASELWRAFATFDADALAVAGN